MATYIELYHRVKHFIKDKQEEWFYKKKKLTAIEQEIVEFIRNNIKIGVVLEYYKILCAEGFAVVIALGELYNNNPLLKEAMKKIIEDIKYEEEIKLSEYEESYVVAKFNDELRVIALEEYTKGVKENYYVFFFSKL